MPAMSLEEKEELMDRMGKNLLVLRTMLRLSQADLAEMIGVSRPTIVSIETGKRRMSWKTFLSLLLIFTKNPNANQMLQVFQISTDQLEAFLMPPASPAKEDIS